MGRSWLCVSGRGDDDETPLACGGSVQRAGGGDSVFARSRRQRLPPLGELERLLRCSTARNLRKRRFPPRIAFSQCVPDAKASSSLPLQQRCAAGDIEVNTSWDDVVIAWVLAIVVVLALMA
jgi:hypothetical protein